MGLERCPEKSIRNYHSTLPKIPEELKFHLLGGGSLKTRIPESTVRRYTHDDRKVFNIGAVPITYVRHNPTYMVPYGYIEETMEGWMDVEI